MPFDMQGFRSAKFEAPTETVGPDVLADGIKAFFQGEEPRWIIRALTGREMYFCRDAEKRSKNVATVLSALSDHMPQVGAIRGAMGLDVKQTSPDFARRLEVLVLGSVSPAVTLDDAVFIAEHFAADFNYLTNKIENLTGQGFDLVKPVAASQATTV